MAMMMLTPPFLLAVAMASFLLMELPLPVSSTSHIVGANRGWQIPAEAGASVNLNYTVWAKDHVFVLNDIISFRYERDKHTVYEVNYSTYVNCTFNMYYGHDWLYNWTNKAGRTFILLNESRTYYFACGKDDHCKQGMKVAIPVLKENPVNTTKASISTPPSNGAVPALWMNSAFSAFIAAVLYPLFSLLILYN